MHNIAGIVLWFLFFIPVGFGQGEIEKLPPSINSDEFDESSAILSRDGTRLFFTRTASPDFEPTMMDENGQLVSNKDDSFYQQRLSLIYSQIAGKTIKDPIHSEYNQDIWITSIIEDSIIGVVHPGYPLNNALTNSLVSTGASPDEFVVINQFFEDGSMYGGFSRVNISEDGQHNFPQPMHIYDFEVNSSDVNLTMTPSGHVIILSMNRSDSRGSNDLFASFYVRNNVWSAPINMGDVINTEFQETTPHITPDKRFLYFSSNRPGGPGGNDIYVSERLDYTWLNWSPPVLVKGAVNSPFDDSQPSFDPKKHYMYFTSRRDGTSDIFRMRLIPMPKLKKPIFIRGTIVDTKTGLPTRCELFWGQRSAKNYMEYINSYNGSFEVTLNEYEPYKFLPRKTGHIAQQILVDPRIIERQGKDTIDLILYISPKAIESMVSTQSEVESFNISREEKINQSNDASGNKDGMVNEKLFIYNIQFVRAKTTILTKSNQALEDLLELLNTHPTMEIRIEGHTDNVGDEVALVNLSEERAETVRDYLVNNGIEKERIDVIGLGATHPIGDNLSESGREKNRRVEIKITKY
jgi:outer membrane protein OmpA-like peptidoglycan-associated protein